MPTIASKCRSSFGTDCIQCGTELIAPERSEYWNERHILHHWCCLEMRLLFRGHFACGHQVDKRHPDEDRRYHSWGEVRRFAQPRSWKR
jgi:hypothetical protein